jgi:hypothetical protein
MGHKVILITEHIRLNAKMSLCYHRMAWFFFFFLISQKDFTKKAKWVVGEDPFLGYMTSFIRFRLSE